MPDTNKLAHSEANITKAMGRAVLVNVPGQPDVILGFSLN